MSGANFLERLLNGVNVEWLPLGDLTRYEQPTKYLVAAKNYSDNFATPVLTAGQTFILGYTDEVDGIYRASESPVIIFDDFTTANKWVDFDFKVKSSAMKMITSKDEGRTLLRYIYYWLNTQPSEFVDGDHKRQWISSYTGKKVPIPCPEKPQKSLQIQAEIVRILDTFTELNAELTAELTARRKQYKYYREQLLSFEDSDVEWKTLEDVTRSIASGRNKDRAANGPIPVYGSTGLIGFTSEAAYSGEVLLVARVGANAGRVNAVSGTFDVSDNTLIVRPKDEWDIRFAFHQLTQMNLNQYAVGGGQPLVTGGLLKGLKIPFPSMFEQKRIAGVLDKFHALTTSLKEGLPHEIELRQKQYEYYRSLLMSFPKPEEVKA